MLRRLSFVTTSLLLSCLVTIPAFASSRVVAQQSAKRGKNTVYLSKSLKPTRRYQIQVIAKGHAAFTGLGTEQVVGVFQGHLYTAHPSLKLKGTTPQTFALSPPSGGRVTSWVVAVDVQSTKGKGLTVRMLDVGAR